MVNNNTKYWSFTWETNVTQKKLPDETQLMNFLNSISDFAQFQLEEGVKSGKLHYQGCLELSGSRQPKKELLDAFQRRFKNVGGLSLQKVFSKQAILSYTSKPETRVGETIYCGKKEMYNSEYKGLLTRPWQKHMYQHMLDVARGVHPESERHLKRSIYWIEDKHGGAGKSEFITWLRAGQRELICRMLPMDSVDRLLHAVTEIAAKEKIDVFMIDDTKTKGDHTSFNNLFEAIERIKNGHVVSTMYGHYSEVIYKRPQILFCTNRFPGDYLNNLSRDRWSHFVIMDRTNLVSLGFPVDDVPKIKYYDSDHLETESESDDLQD